MPVEILMPELGESVHEGTVSRWLKKEGEFVKEDEPVVEIMTDKVNTELPSPASGTLIKIIVPEGSPVQVFHAMGLIDDGSGGEVAADSTPAPAAEAKSEPAPVVEQTAPTANPNGQRAWYSPVVRAIAKANNLTDDVLGNIKGTGQGGRVTKKDVEGFLAGGSAPSVARIEPKPVVTPSIAGPEQELVPLAGMRKMIAEAMVRSSQVPTVTTMTQVDVTAMVQFRERNKESFQIAMNKGVHIGVAVALGKNGDEGLIVPVIRDCHKKGLVDLAKDLEEIARKARSNALSVTDVQGGTFTLTNPGTYGALFGTPMINAPQAGILGAYAITKQPVIVDDMIAIRSIMHLVLTYDHRLVDGLLAGKFLAGIRDRLQKFDFFK
ncbi:MAG TPA: dihydrolipoamide acetyltransferase family protein [Fimbriimonadaceae bacterium]|nr:dihydrolipoamide acetyltransferase family protein [Fimbriimonadaceae bacterium]